MSKGIFTNRRWIFLIVIVVVAALITGGAIYWFNRPVMLDEKTKTLVSKYRDMKLTDTHDHAASGSQYKLSIKVWNECEVNRVVLFGDLPSPEAVISDKNAWAAYQQYPEIVMPFISGFDIHDESCLTYIRSNLEKGCFGLGELVGASTGSPLAAKTAWKAMDPMDGYFPQVYDLAAEYHAPVLLHIDPPAGNAIAKFEEALDSHPDTIFIYGHANAYNTIENLDRLMNAHKNLYLDFFAGFTAFNPDSQLTLKDYVPLIKRYPDRILLSTDSGYGLNGGLVRAYEACYLLLDQLNDTALAKKIAYTNFDRIIRSMPATDTQLKALKSLGSNVTDDLPSISKYKAGMTLIENNYDMKD